MLRYSFDMEEPAKRIENAVRKVLADGYRTADIMQEGGKKVGTDAMGEAVVAAVRATGWQAPISAARAFPHQQN